MILDRIPTLLDSHFMVNIVAGHRILIAQSVPCPALLWPMLCFLITELAKTELWSVIKALVQTSVKLCHKKKHKLCRQNKRRQEILWVNFLCGLYCSLYRNINSSYFEFYHDTLLDLAKSGTRLKSEVLSGSKSCRIWQCSHLVICILELASLELPWSLQCSAYIDFHPKLSWGLMWLGDSGVSPILQQEPFCCLALGN